MTDRAVPARRVARPPHGHDATPEARPAPLRRRRRGAGPPSAGHRLVLTRAARRADCPPCILSSPAPPPAPTTRRSGRRAATTSSGSNAATTAARSATTRGPRCPQCRSANATWTAVRGTGDRGVLHHLLPAGAPGVRRPGSVQRRGRAARRRAVHGEQPRRHRQRGDRGRPPGRGAPSSTSTTT